MKKFGIAGALAAIVAIGAPVAASAGTTNVNYSLTISKFGGWGVTANQTKSQSDVAGSVRVDYVANNYKIGASMMRGDVTNEGTKRYDIGAGTTASLQNKLKAGNAVFMKVWGNIIWPINVQTNGAWRSN